MFETIEENFKLCFSRENTRKVTSPHAVNKT